MEIVPEFTEADLRSISRQKGVVYSLGGLSLEGLQLERTNLDKPSFWYSYLEGITAENERGLIGQVAIFPEDPMLQGGYYKTLFEQLKLVRSHAKDLDLIYAQAIVGTIATLAEALFAHADAKGEYLLPNVYARSTTVLAGPYVVSVGDSHPDEGFGVCYWDRDERNDNLGVLRAVVPVKK